MTNEKCGFCGSTPAENHQFSLSDDLRYLSTHSVTLRSIKRALNVMQRMPCSFQLIFIFPTLYPLKILIITALPHRDA